MLSLLQPSVLGPAPAAPAQPPGAEVGEGLLWAEEAEGKGSGIAEQGDFLRNQGMLESFQCLQRHLIR